MRWPKSEERWEQICEAWERMDLQNTCAVEAAKKLNVSPATLVTALRTMRPGAYDPNCFKHRRPRVYVYQKCKYCGADTSIRIDITTVDEAENRKMGNTSIYVCRNCILKQNKI